MSVTWRPPRKLLPFLAVFLCLVSALSLVAQQEEIPAAASVQSEETVVSETPVSVSETAPAAIAPEVPEPMPTTADDAAPVAAVQSEEVAAEPAPTVAEPVAAEPVSETVAAPVTSVEPAATAVVAEPAATQPTEEKSAEPAATASEKAAEPAAVAAPAPAPAADAPAAPAAAVEVPQTFRQKMAHYVDVDRLNVLLIIICLLGFVSYFTFHAQRGKELFIRRISGLSALEDAVGRATEMGRGVLYIPGIMDMDDIQTIAGVTILGHVAKKTAEYDTPLYAPMTRSFVMSVAQEIVKQAYLEKGRPDAFRPDRINYMTDDQFGYVAGVGGIMMRDKPAACFYLGTFYAESLILAETGNSIGAIQIAGTAEPSQIPFFVAACDYTLIGEELFAASAYLSKNPKEVGSLKGQDISKIIIIAFVIVGTVLMSIAQTEFGAQHGIASIADTYMKLFK